jgi:hypothetical protein
MPKLSVCVPLPRTGLIFVHRRPPTLIPNSMHVTDRQRIRIDPLGASVMAHDDGSVGLPVCVTPLLARRRVRSKFLARPDRSEQTVRPHLMAMWVGRARGLSDTRFPRAIVRRALGAEGTIYLSGARWSALLACAPLGTIPSHASAKVRCVRGRLTNSLGRRSCMRLSVADAASSTRPNSTPSGLSTTAPRVVLRHYSFFFVHNQAHRFLSFLCVCERDRRRAQVARVSATAIGNDGGDYKANGPWQI